MKRYLLIFLVVISVSVIAYNYSVVSFLLIVIAGLSLLFLAFAGLVKAIRKSVHSGWLKIPLVIVIICVVGVVVGLLKPVDPPVIKSGDVSEQLAHAYTTDQGDRKNLRFYLFLDKMRKRDSIRLSQVKRLYNEQLIKLPLDKFHAAFILHHSNDSEQYKIAHDLAGKAADELKDNYQVQWLAKATYDRWMLSIGEPQKYGTQGGIDVSVK